MHTKIWKWRGNASVWSWSWWRCSCHELKDQTDTFPGHVHIFVCMWNVDHKSRHWKKDTGIGDEMFQQILDSTDYLLHRELTPTCTLAWEWTSTRNTHSNQHRYNTAAWCEGTAQLLLFVELKWLLLSEAINHLVGLVVKVSACKVADQGSVSWRPTTVKWQQFSQSNRYSTIGTRQTEYHEALPSSANDEVRRDCTFADDGNSSWNLVCRVPMVEWRLDCENCRHLTVVGLHDTGPRLQFPLHRASFPGQVIPVTYKLIHHERFSSAAHHKQPAITTAVPRNRVIFIQTSAQRWRFFSPSQDSMHTSMSPKLRSAGATCWQEPHSFGDWVSSAAHHKPFFLACVASVNGFSCGCGWLLT